MIQQSNAQARQAESFERIMERLLGIIAGQGMLVQGMPVREAYKVPELISTSFACSLCFCIKLYFLAWCFNFQVFLYVRWLFPFITHVLEMERLVAWMEENQEILKGKQIAWHKVVKEGFLLQVMTIPIKVKRISDKAGDMKKQ